MDEFDYWRLCDSLNIFQAAALIVGDSPSSVYGGGSSPAYLGLNPFDAAPSGADPEFQAAMTALKAAIRSGTLKAAVRVSARKYGEADAQADNGYAELVALMGDELDLSYQRGQSAHEGELLSDDESFFYRPFPDWKLTTITVDDLRVWLTSRGFTKGFFFPDQEEGKPGYLDDTQSNYAPKLAAAIRAWEAVTSEPERLHGKSPKAALSKWINEHAALYGLTKDDGTPNVTGVEEVAKVANWKPEGGASKTPVS